jgi:peptide/nickel transport system permease protein
MLRYAIQRIVLLIPLVIGLSFVIFMYLRLLPGDPVATMLGPGAPPGLIAQLRHDFGLDQPLLAQYVNWVEALTRGDLGISFASRQPIAPLLINRIPATLQLTIGGIFFAVLIGLPLGFIAGLRKDTKLDRLLSIGALVGLSTPAFWLGTIMILVVAVNLRWLPSAGYAPLLTDPVASLRFMLMPSLVIGIALAPYLARMTRAATVEVQQEPFVAFATGKGLKRRTIIGRYSFRNAIVPVVIVLSLQLGNLLGGVFVVETLFAWPGLGRLMVSGISQRDYFMVQAILLVVAVIWIVLNLCAELIHAWLDPRIRLG